MGPPLIYDELRRIRQDRGLSRSQLSRLTVGPGYSGVPEKTIQALETYPGRVPDADIIEALASALGVPPEHFYEWPIAAARRSAKDLRAHEAEEVLQSRERRQAPPQTSPAVRAQRGSNRG
jgi:transcriptional regulator with XRE-family HTH domain